jgi:demethylmenaquinone methyltransferase/2-methoxy-6-polyprenyl-1,4-benzoquinol methylase
MEAEEYERMAAVEATHWWYAATRALLHQLVGPALAAGGRFLDAGGGTGATGAWMGEQGALVASDALPAALSLYARAHPSLAGAAAADVRALPFPDRTFDAVLCVTVLCHRSIADPAVAVAELARVTRPGGLVVLMEPGVRRLRRAHDRVTHSARRFSVGDLRVAAVAAGLEVSRATGAYSFLVPPAAAKTLLERGRSTSDLDRHGSGFGGLLGGAAAVERRVLRRVSLPAGLSVVVVAHRP